MQPERRTSTLALDSMDFEGVLGRGGMATVHAARMPDGLRVAVKVGERMSERGRRRFLAEARALATIDHPRVVGALGLGTCRGEHPFTPEGAPFLVMERGLGTLDPDAVTSWAELERVLGDVLRGLAELHGHGFVHRDVKPANILRFEAGYRIADLGVVADAEHVAPDIVGTPMCMAPEQILGDARSLGPHTDLYGLAAAAWRVVSGTWPYFDFRPLPVAPLEEALPPLEPRFDVPHALEAWLGILLRRNPYARYRSAAHALAALQRLEDDFVQGGSERVVPEGRAMATLDLDTLEPSPSAPHLVEADVPPIPVWSVPLDPPRTLPSVLPARSELWSVRPTPWVGRVDETRRLWALGCELIAKRRPGIAVIAGPTGMGKSRLARWVGRHLHSLAGARYVVVPAGDGPFGTTLGDVLESAFRVRGLNETAARDRVARLTLAPPRADAVEVDELLRLLGVFDGPGVLNPLARDRLLARVIHRIGRLVLVLDDVASDAPVLRSALELLEHHPDLPLLLLLTTEDPALLADRPDVERVHLGPLNSTDFERLSTLMGSSPECVTEVLRSDDLSPAVAAELFVERIEPPDNRALRLAVLLGRSFPTPVFRAAAQHAGIPSSEVDALFETRALVPIGADRVEIAGAVYETESIREPDLHAAVAAVVDPDVAPIAYARHCIASGQGKKAFPWLRRALARARASGDGALVRTLAKLLLDAQEEAGSNAVERADLELAIADACVALLHEEDRRTLGWRAVEACRGLDPERRMQAFIYLTNRGCSYEAGAELFQMLLAENRDIEASLQARLALLALFDGHRDAARARLDPIEPPALTQVAIEHYWRARAELAWQDGDFDTADDAAIRSAEAAPVPDMAPTQVIRGWIAMERGDLDAAQHIFEQSVRANTRVGLALSAHDALLGLASILERRGRIQEAIDLNIEVARIYETLRSMWAAAPVANVAMLLLRLGRVDEAALAVERVQRIGEDTASPSWRLVAAYLQLAVLPSDADWPAAIDEALARRAKTQFWDPDLDRALDYAMDRCPLDLHDDLAALRTPTGTP